VTGRELGTVANAMANAYPNLRSTPEGELFNNSDKTLLGCYFQLALEMDVTAEALWNDSEGVRQLATLSYQIGYALREDAIVSNPTLVRSVVMAVLRFSSAKWLCQLDYDYRVPGTRLTWYTFLLHG
jgi:hypothetical protein